MKALLGLAFALGGLVIGTVVGALLGALAVAVFHVTSREGAAGYLVVAAGLLGGLAGVVGGLMWHAHRAPSGETLGAFGQGTLGVIGLVALLAAGVWGWMQTREDPVVYDGQTQANLLLEFRIAEAQARPGAVSQWMSVEVTTANTRPEVLLLRDKLRREGGQLVIPGIQGPLIRSGSRLIVARLRDGDRHRDEVFQPPIPRKPDPRADWSPWVAPVQVFSPNETGTPAPQLQLRWKIELYGQ